jgi:hypothetical protein
MNTKGLGSESYLQSCLHGVPRGILRVFINVLDVFQNTQILRRIHRCFPEQTTLEVAQTRLFTFAAESRAIICLF